MGFSHAVGVVGVLMLAHAAYATIQYRSLLKITEEQFMGPPITVVVELVAGLFFCLWAALTVPGKFLLILPQSDENRVVALPFNLDFMIFNHRGKAFSLGIDMKIK
ncbi:membrane magnesium transporter-like [Salvia divinorum]|uniref:Membrane magnesium transporter-like n=1 Tax=Salvia divinorum TaxID=28513 RepID=A0ABD1GB18_SALDI